MHINQELFKDIIDNITEFVITNKFSKTFSIDKFNRINSLNLNCSLDKDHNLLSIRSRLSTEELR